jgi:hypothetical protein
MTTQGDAETGISFSKLKIGRKTHRVSDMAEASRIFRASVGDRGASAMPDGILLNDDGKQVGHVSYNGRVWKGVHYVAGADALYCPSGFLGDPAKLYAAFRQAADALGWRWSHAHGGYISEGHRNGSEWSDYFVAMDTRDACFQDGVETFEQAQAAITRLSADAEDRSPQA